MNFNFKITPRCLLVKIARFFLKTKRGCILLKNHKINRLCINFIIYLLAAEEKVMKFIIKIIINIIIIMFAIIMIIIMLIMVIIMFFQIMIIMVIIVAVIIN